MPLNALLTPRKYRLPRVWSNEVLRAIGPAFAGEIINVSAWEDGDKEGGFYRDYFAKATRYSRSNYGGTHGSSDQDDYALDLEAPLPAELQGQFDVAFNHTTLEHVFDVFTAVRNLCAMSRDVVIVVVPFAQQVHTGEGWSDYWRFTAHGVRRLFESNGLEVVYLTSSPYRHASIYHLAVASKHPERWRDVVKGFPAPYVNLGEDLVKDNLLVKIKGRLARTTNTGP